MEENDAKEIFEHLYTAGISAIKAMKELLPEFSLNSKAAREMRAAQKEFLFAVRAAVDRQLKFIEGMESRAGRNAKKVEVKRK